MTTAEFIDALLLASVIGVAISIFVLYWLVKGMEDDDAEAARRSKSAEDQ